MHQADLPVAFIGAGNMATSLIKGLLQGGADPSALRVADPEPAQLARLTDTGVSTHSQNKAAVEGAAVVVLAVKPQVAGAALEPLALTEDQLLVSIAAGITVDSLKHWTTQDQPVIRCMPNTPALLGAGISALYATETCSAVQRSQGEDILRAGGETVWVQEEALLDAVTAVSGSGPAYFFLLMETLTDAGVALGLDREVAERLALQTAYGAALMARQGDDSPAVLREKVTSPGGTTAAALKVMADEGLPSIVGRAVSAAAGRAKALAREFGTTGEG